ncbi:tripartite tricarboxylate transporter substrate binding protein [Saccharopolyspora sp. K220]|uniref:Bug family tripartite tricarboxylate transporter substrate binding protein n=1 Tax=Saccharopolyspora soli TaxID=2926618 RepID=UPI001F59C66D|nr:tripartite tricarboxylate transporter substrate binding protein [Saccharopolyspora soli]MCI2418390.1 tripartite tricarboxylate transporter substrate binding protein [Saccharopolyspora soli]
MIRRTLAAFAAVTLLAGCSVFDRADADTAQGPLAGQTIELIVPFEPGGGYDLYARQLAPELGKKLHAEVVVINKPGAGGLLATNDVWKSKPDGTKITLLNTVGHLGSALAGAQGVRYRAQDFSYIGRISGEPDLTMAAASSPYDTLQDLYNAHEQIRAVATGPGSNEYIDAVVVNAALKLDSKVVTGFVGSGEAWLAVMSGYATCHSRSLSSQLPAVNSGDAKPLLIIGDQPVPELPGVPTLSSLANDANRNIIEDHVRLIASGRSLAGPPGMDPAVLEALRTAFREVVTDPRYIADAKTQKRPVDFASGEDIDRLVDEVMHSSPEYVALLREAFGG